ncbi:MAG TPA: RHS repeat-associated core domain-containing protein, partial [Spirochaetia bacterium]
MTALSILLLAILIGCFAAAPAQAADVGSTTHAQVSAGKPPARGDLDHSSPRALGDAAGIDAPVRDAAGYYDPNSGRFTSRDPVWDPANLGSHYAFVGNNPESRLDPLGESCWSKIGEGLERVWRVIRREESVAKGLVAK